MNSRVYKARDLQTNLEDKTFTICFVPMFLAFVIIECYDNSTYFTILHEFKIVFNETFLVNIITCRYRVDIENVIRALTTKFNEDGLVFSFTYRHSICQISLGNVHQQPYENFPPALPILL